MAQKSYDFVKFDVSDLELELASDDLPVLDDWPFIVEEWVGMGYKFSQSYNVDTGSWITSLTGKNTQTPSDGKVVSVFSGSIGRGVQKIAYLTHICSNNKCFVTGLSEAKAREKANMRKIRETLGLK